MGGTGILTIKYLCLCFCTNQAFHSSLIMVLHKAEISLESFKDVGVRSILREVLITTSLIFMLHPLKDQRDLLIEGP